MDWKILLVTQGTLIIAVLGAAWIGARALIRTNKEQLDRQTALERKRRDDEVRNSIYEKRAALYVRFASTTNLVRVKSSRVVDDLIGEGDQDAIDAMIGPLSEMRLLASTAVFDLADKLIKAMAAPVSTEKEAIVKEAGKRFADAATADLESLRPRSAR